MSGLHGLSGDPGPGRGRSRRLRGGHGHGAPGFLVGRGEQPAHAPAAAAGRAVGSAVPGSDRHLPAGVRPHPGGGLLPAAGRLFAGRVPGGGRGARRPAGGGDPGAVIGRGRHEQRKRSGAAAVRRGRPGRGAGDLRRQDRDAHPKPHDGHRLGRARPGAGEGLRPLLPRGIRGGRETAGGAHGDRSRRLGRRLGRGTAGADRKPALPGGAALRQLPQADVHPARGGRLHPPVHQGRLRAGAGPLHGGIGRRGPVRYPGRRWPPPLAEPGRRYGCAGPAGAGRRLPGWTG